jgi:sulfonate transport system substrate-binding protein
MAPKAFGRGSLDAWAIYGYPIQRAIFTQGARVLTTALGFLSGNYILSATTAALADAQRVEWIGQHINQLQRAYAWARTHEPEWIAAVAKDIGVPETMCATSSAAAAAYVRGAPRDRAGDRQPAIGGRCVCAKPPHPRHVDVARCGTTVSTR